MRKNLDQILDNFDNRIEEEIIKRPYLAIENSDDIFFLSHSKNSTLSTYGGNKVGYLHSAFLFFRKSNSSVIDGEFIVYFLK